MMSRLFLAVFVAVIFSVIGGSPYKKSEPPIQVDENTSSRGDTVLIGDMVLSKEWFRNKNSGSKRVKRQAYDDEYKWPKTGDTVVIPYTQNGVDSKVLQRAIEVFNSKTCIRFVPRNSQHHYVTFQRGSGCSTVVGFRVNKGRHLSTLSSNCASNKGKVLHEMMHILGFLHEQCRPDRDNYITVHTNNIKPGAEKEFQKIPGKDLGIPYDCDSILHYKATAFGKTPSAVTISSSKCSKIGNNDERFSLLDYKRVNIFYKCHSNPNYRFFKVKVETHRSFLAGTDCFIYLKLHGRQRTSTEFELDLDDAGSSDLFERNSVHTFSYMAYRDDLGPILGISIRMVSNGRATAWWPRSFTIYDPVNKQKVKFGNQAWLKPPSTYGPSYFRKQ